MNRAALVLPWVLGGAVLAWSLPAVFGEYGFYLGSSLCVWMIFALAYDLAYGRTGLLSFGHAIFFGVGAYALVLLIMRLDWSFWPALAGAVLATAVFSVVVGSIALRVTGHAFVVITVIFGGIVELVAYSRKEVTNGEDGLSFDLESVSFGVVDLAIVDAANRYFFMLGWLVAVFLLLAWINASTLGRTLRAIKSNPHRATLLGYPVQRYRLLAFTVSGALSGLAGALFGLLNYHVSAEAFGITVSINPLTSVLVGGAGTMLGPVIGTAFIFVLWDTLRSVVVYADFVIGGILILTVLFAPQGIVGLLRRALRARRRSAVDREATAQSTAGDD